MSSARPLLASLAPLVPGDRIAKVVATVRALPPPKQHAFVAELDAGSPYEQYFAALAALAVRDKAWVQAHLADPSKPIQQLALTGATPQLVPDQEIARALQGDVSKLARKALLRRGLVRRPALAVQLLPSVRAAWGDSEAVVVLSHCPAQTVARVLPELLAALLTGRHWHRLAATHPTILLDVLAQDASQLNKRGILPSDWWAAYGEGVVILLKKTRSPALITKALDLLESTLHGTFPQILQDALPILARAEPLRIIKYFASGELHNTLSRKTSERLFRASLGTPELLQYAKRGLGFNILPSLPPKARTELWQAVRPPPYTRLPPRIELDFLPAADCASVAKQVLQSADLPPHQRLQALSYLPPSEADSQQTNKAALRKADAQQRADGYTRYITQAKRTGDPAVWAATLADVSKRIKNEQAPVREQVISAITDDYKNLRLTQGTEVGTDPRLFSKDSLAPLKEIIIDADQAPDRIHRTVASLYPLAMRIVAHLGQDKDVLAWGQEMVTIFSPEYLFDFPVLDFSRGKERLLWALLGARVEALAQEDHYALVTGLAEELGARAEEIPALQALIAQGVNESSKADSIAHKLVEIYLKPKSSRADRLAELLQKDASVVNIPEVAKYVVRTQPETLAEVLSSPPPTGRFLDPHDAKGWVFPASPRDLRMVVPETLKLYRDQLEKGIQSARWDWDRREMIRRLAQVPGGQDVIASVVRQGLEGSEDVRTFERRLKALAAPQYLTLLLSHAADQHARVALPTATKAAAGAPLSVVRSQFVGLLDGNEAKVTSRKAAVHALARMLPIPETAGIFAAEVGKPELHRDVLTEIVSLTCSHLLGSDEGWKILDQVIAPLPEEQGAGVLDAQAKTRIEDRVDVRLELVKVKPFQIPSQYWERYAGAVVKLAGSKDEALAAEAIQAMKYWGMFNHDAYPVLEEAVTNLSRRSVRIWTCAADSIAALSYTQEGQKTLYSSVTRLLRVNDPSLDAGRDWDLPNVRLVKRFAFKFNHLLELGGAYKQAAWAFAKTLVRSEKEANLTLYVLLACLVDINRLAAKPVIPSHVPDTLAALVDGEVPEPAVLLGTLGKVLAPLPGLVSQVTMLIQSSKAKTAGKDMEGLVALLDWLQGLSQTHGLLALTLVSKLGAREGWTDPWRTLVRKLRDHPAPDVRALALDINTSDTHF